MAQKRTRFKVATLVASTNPLRHIQAKRLIMAARVVGNVNPSVLSLHALGVRENTLQGAYS